MKLEPPTDRQRKLVRSSLPTALAAIPDIGERFYAKLFTIAPEIRPLFPSDTRAQEEKLVAMVAFLVQISDNPDDLEWAVSNLGRRHDAYGAKPAHYAAVLESLLDVLSDGLGQDFNPELRQAWTAILSDINDRMVRA